MKVNYNNKVIELTQQDYVATGGEATIYCKNNVIFKIFLSSNNSIPLKKISELQNVLGNNQFVIAPTGITFDLNNNYNGFTMKRVHGLPLCNFFSNTFHKKNNITHDNTLSIVEKLKSILSYVHTQQCLIVDVNEFNFLVNENTLDTFAIDVNSYQTPSYQATAIMENIQDFHSSKFSELTDWYSFAILSCQLLIGIHPFGGTNSKYSQPVTTIQRMKDNISIFNKNSKVPKTTRDFGLIPNEYLEWYIKLFEHGKRLLPPNSMTKTIIQTIMPKITIPLTGKFFIIQNIETYTTDIVKYYKFLNQEIIVTEDNTYLHNKPTSKFEHFIINENVYGVSISKLGNLELVNLKTNMKHQTNYTYSNIQIVNNKVITIMYDKLLQLSMFNNQLILDSSWDILPFASKLFENCVFQDILNKPYFYIPFIINEKTNMAILNIKELQSHKILDAKFQNRILMVLTYYNSVYYKFIFNVSENYSQYQLITKIENVKFQDLNFAVLHSGTGISIEDDGFYIFNNNIPDFKILKDPDVDINITLCSNGTNILFYKQNKLYKLSMKN